MHSERKAREELEGPLETRFVEEYTTTDMIAREEGTLRRTLIVFRAKNINTYNRKKEQRGMYHASYRLNVMQKTSTTKTLCGLTLYVDWASPFKMTSPKNEMTKDIFFFIEECKKRNQVISRNITSQMCKRCLRYVIDQLRRRLDI
jgi:hypothetical protein